MGHRPLGPTEIDGLLWSPGKAYTRLVDHLITRKPLWLEVVQVKPAIHIGPTKHLWLTWMVLF